MSWLSNWWDKWIGHTSDDLRNFGWRISEYFRVEVESAKYVVDLRMGFKREGKWRIGQLRIWKPVEQNFWNGMFTANIYVSQVRFLRRTIPFWLPRMNLVIRYSKDHPWLIGVGWLFDRGEFGFKFAHMCWWSEKYEYGCTEPRGWDEGSI